MASCAWAVPLKDACGRMACCAVRVPLAGTVVQKALCWAWGGCWCGMSLHLLASSPAKQPWWEEAVTGPLSSNMPRCLPRRSFRTAVPGPSVSWAGGLAGSSFPPRCSSHSCLPLPSDELGVSKDGGQGCSRKAACPCSGALGQRGGRRVSAVTGRPGDHGPYTCAHADGDGGDGLWSSDSLRSRRRQLCVSTVTSQSHGNSTWINIEG